MIRKGLDFAEESRFKMHMLKYKKIKNDAKQHLCCMSISKFHAQQLSVYHFSSNVSVIHNRIKRYNYVGHGPPTATAVHATML